ncbi:type I-E CRISPR-associated endoribonuclease Cas2e [Oleidesulfovibrio alaskensis]|jgi:CRISPR-associated protein Cas2|uniref:type I-E CRISPR-associated endoribonuclease Cas2e n=1 Tax=Oleidesulfovibrio alaskensis TaxID=58180 RepID=UPI001A5B377A|nr:type I-E CRISPR-associated endoribonuclease Cas2e [Oleidesulfovibrio alaskensis]MBL3580953.1 type I-E CRISPR-associated endoribonuclease Cas2 [Oleidesulfovibrio alaskensis]
MLVVLANDLPAAVRGRMKLWFVEPRPNVFVSGLKDSVANEVVDYLYQHCSLSAGILIFKSLPKPPGYEIRTIGTPTRSITELNGLQLVFEKSGPGTLL